MSILKVARMGHPVLRAKARPVERADIGSPKIQQLIDDMIETMVEYHGVGLAAPQVHEGVRLFVAAIGPGADEGARGAGTDEASPPLVVLNPEIVQVGSEVVDDWEGCLSIPDLRGRVPRAREIRIRALDRRGERIELRAREYSARVIQHEADHLDGVLFLDRMRTLDSLAFLDEYSRYWAKDD
jgi:peptide deformylase